MATSTERHRSERGIILHLLVAENAEWTAFRTLWRMMDRRGFSVSRDNLTFHLRYLARRKFVVLKLVRDMEKEGTLHIDGSMRADQIMFAQIAPDGLAVVNEAIRDLEVAL